MDALGSSSARIVYVLDRQFVGNVHVVDALETPSARILCALEAFGGSSICALHVLEAVGGEHLLVF